MIEHLQPLLVNRRDEAYRDDVRVTFGDDNLRGWFQDFALATSQWGPDAGRSYVSLVIALQAAPTLADIVALRSFGLTNSPPPPNRYLLGRPGAGLRISVRHTEPDALVIDSVEEC